VIRNIERKDLPTILDIYNDAILNTTAVYTYDAQQLSDREAWFESKVLANEPIFVYELNNKVVGFSTYGQFRNWPAYLYTIEHSIYVEHSHRGKGIATQLLQHLIEHAKQKNYRTMVAGIDTSNSDSIHLHEKLGFTHAGTLKNVGYKFEDWLDLAFYQLDLKND